jgi:carboxyl-terminal processing protease
VPSFGADRESDLNHVLSNSGGTPQASAPPRADLPAMAKDIQKLPPEGFPTFDPTKPDTDYQLQQALKVVQAMPPVTTRASRL